MPEEAPVIRTVSLFAPLILPGGFYWLPHPNRPVRGQ
jgi:hypothetical protein